jgi:hypothetical protein
MFVRRGGKPIKLRDLHHYYVAFPQLAVLQVVLTHPKIYKLSSEWSWRHGNGALTLSLKAPHQPHQP